MHHCKLPPLLLLPGIHPKCMVSLWPEEKPVLIIACLFCYSTHVENPETQSKVTIPEPYHDLAEVFSKSQSLKLPPY